jgi:hypothetical protein
MLMRNRHHINRQWIHFNLNYDKNVYFSNFLDPSFEVWFNEVWFNLLEYNFFTDSKEPSF